MADNTTVLDVQARVDKAVQQFGVLQKSIDKVSDQVGKMGQVTKRAGEVMEMFKAHVVFEKLKGVLESVVGAYAESEAATNALKAALENNGMAADEVAKRYGEIASKIQDKTAAEDDSIVSGMAMMQ